MYIIDQNQAKSFAEQLTHGISAPSPIFLIAKDYTSKTFNINITAHNVRGSKSLCIAITEASSGAIAKDTITILADWSDRYEMDDILHAINHGGLSTQITSVRANGDRVLRDASIIGMMDGCLIIDVAPNQVCVDGINEPEDIITAFNLLQKRSAAIGHPIVYDIPSKSAPLELVYDGHYCSEVVVNTSAINEAMSVEDEEEDQWI